MTAINWVYDPNDFESRDFPIIPEGDHRVRISDVVSKHFKSGNDGFEITLDVSGYSGKVWYYLVFDRTDAKKTNQRLGSFFESFGITDYNLAHFQQWKGKVGAVRVIHEQYNGANQAKVQFCVSRKKQEKLPPWKGNSASPAAPAAPTTDFAPVEISDDELPFA